MGGGHLLSCPVFANGRSVDSGPCAVSWRMRMAGTGTEERMAHLNEGHLGLRYAKTKVGELV